MNKSERKDKMGITREKDLKGWIKQVVTTIIQTTTVQIQVGSQPLKERLVNNQSFSSVPIPLTCPLCQEKDIEVGTWGSYPTTTGDVICFRWK
jgi:hypothetical protein